MGVISLFPLRRYGVLTRTNVDTKLNTTAWRFKRQVEQVGELNRSARDHPSVFPRARTAPKTHPQTRTRSNRRCVSFMSLPLRMRRITCAIFQNQKKV